MAVLATEKILTLDYWKPAYHVQVGDYVFDRKGEPVKVTLVQEYMATNCYTVNLNDYLTINGDAKMEFLIETVKYRKRLCEYKGRYKFRRPLKPTALSTLLNENLKTSTNRMAFSIPTCDPLKLPTQYLPIPPFIFGFWFFNRLRENEFSTKVDSLEFLETQLADNGYEITKKYWMPQESKKFHISPSIESQLKPNVPHLIPNNYLLASEEQRLDLLKGIMAAKSRQYSTTKNLFRFSDRNVQKVKQVQCLVESLGIKTKLEYQDSIKTYSLVFKTRHQLVANQRPYNKPVFHQGRRYIKSIESIKPQSCVYIETDGEDGTYLVGEGFIACR